MDPYSGSFIESPSYIFNDGRELQDIPVEALVRDAVVLDFSHKEGGQTIDDEDFEGAEESAGLAIREGEVAVLYTGKENASGMPVAVSENGAQYLEFKRVAGVATDLGCLDATDDLVAHRVLMRKGIFVIENLCNLGSIDQSRFRLIALPLKIEGSRSAVRVIAILNND